MWVRDGTVVANVVDPVNEKLAMFDLDGTLVVSPSGRIGDSAYVWIPHVESRLKFLVDTGHQLVIVSNQSRFGAGTQEKFERIRNDIIRITGQEPIILIATGKDEYRKPGTGLVGWMLSRVPKQDYAGFYVGDASGEDDPDPRYRWASSDRDFATAVGIPFHRPVEFFPPVVPRIPTVPTLVVMVGMPGSGKSTVAQASGLTVCSKDVLKSRTAKCVSEAIRRGESVVVDATHPSRASREEWYEMARDAVIPIEVWWSLRDGKSFNALRTKPVPTIAYNMYMSKFDDPRGDGVPVAMFY